MESEDYHFYQGLVYLLENDVSTLGYDLTFSTEVPSTPPPPGTPQNAASGCPPPQVPGVPPLLLGGSSALGVAPGPNGFPFVLGCPPLFQGCP